MIENLDASKEQEALAVLTRAFGSHPMLPPDTPAQTTAALLQLMVRTFVKAEKAWLHGIRKDGALACVAFSLDAQSEPKGAAILLFFIRLFRILGWRMTREFINAFSKRPKYSNRYLELMLLGTLPAFHGQGLGKAMLDFLYGHARAQGYHGIILGAAKETPAYRFYVREGFVTDSEIIMNGMPLCNMRRDNA